MLTEIHIRHLATIESLQLDLSAGTTVITGETGAGKSILIDAIELALGSRATGEMVRSGQEKADISLTFDLHQLMAVKEWLKNHDFDNQTDECIIRRTLNKDGRSRSYINGTPTTLQHLRGLSDLLINIHGQHEHQALFKQDMQRNMLDKYAGHQQQVGKVRDAAEQWHKINSQINELKKASADRTSRSEFLRFQLNELEALHLRADEMVELDAEHKQLANADKLLQNLHAALQFLSENEETNALDLLNHARNSLDTVQSVDSCIKSWVENLNSAILQLTESQRDLQHYLKKVNLDPIRLQEIEQRMSILYDVSRKHKINPNQLYELQQQIAAELETLDTSEEHLTALMQELSVAEATYLRAAATLSDSRKEAAHTLSLEITTLIQELSLPHGNFQIALTEENSLAFSPYGREKITFLITTNIGQPLQPIAKIASGGELSRISLAIHMATAEQHTIPTLIFDEVDVGISGATAEIVGKLLRRLGNTHQLLCITHLPQVAAHGHHHLLAAKQHQANATYTEIRFLNQKEKVQEIARLLGGVAITDKTIDHAKEMLAANEA